MPACVCAFIRVFTCTFIWTHRYTNHNHACMFASLVFPSLSSFASTVIIYPFGRITSGRRARLPLPEQARGLTSSDGAKPIRHLHAHVTCTRLLVSPGEGWEEGGRRSSRRGVSEQGQAPPVQFGSTSSLIESTT